MRDNLDLSLYLVTDQKLSRGRTHEYIVEQAVRGGVTIVQLREKDVSSRVFYELAKSLMGLLRPLNIPLIINDRLDIALAVEADGLHIGQSDLPYAVARRLMGKDKIIGLSVENLAQAREANELDVDYIGLSPVFSTRTKQDINKPLELSGVKEIIGITKHKTVAIGGMNSLNIESVMKTGVDGIAVVSAIVSQENPQEAAFRLASLIHHEK
ncbi:thiamine phosphate synthase [Saccharicrinis fermentans]|uniref:Thiamine-phosphate synthase n=1 Tax=Saccharicrinis fermentans DSM 9555 = JCM 21142 TaxID=869213 RepID=W7Y3W5_9BACT|nr:thiamine phosphate synthase [Saccharicrinis fermentans]GAF02727.1 thiamine-phosphate synthase [Saccharicrinis fermentans DSM 9555 = JCM 21142]